jgi:prepilin-type N-terminal cleavage/methylation domain-containing protein
MANRADRGFTLIELIIALTIAAVVFAILLWSLRIGYSSVEKGREREAVSQRMRILTDRVTWLLRGTYPYTVTTPEGSVLYFAGTRNSVGFVTTSVDPYSDTLQDFAGLKWVTLFVDYGGLKMQEDIYFAEVFEDQPREEYVFDHTVTDIGFEYLDPGDEGTEADWVDSWDPEEQKYLPSAVKVFITFEHDDQQIEMPPIIVAIKTGQVLGERKEPAASP